MKLQLHKSKCILNEKLMENNRKGRMIIRKPNKNLMIMSMHTGTKTCLTGKDKKQ